MADIRTYGTLVNDTGEAIADASQVYDSKRGKMLDEVLDETAAGIVEFTDDEIDAIARDAGGE